MELPLYYHPTTVCFIDDNDSFLRSLTFDLPKDWSYLSFLTPEEALETINTPHPSTPLVERCFSLNNERDRSLVNFNVNALEQEIKQPDRFARLSVLMIDFSMPTMSGLKFCEHVHDTDIKKALLTGVADENTAVAAFNQGLIDRYIPKSSLATMNQVIPHIEELQEEYFTQFTKRLHLGLTGAPPGFLKDHAVYDYVHEVIALNEIVEYYFVNDPTGYLMLQSDGGIMRLVIQNLEELNAQIAMATRQGAPTSVLNKLKNGHSLGYFYEAPNDYLGHETYPWEEFLLPARIVNGAEKWFVGLSTQPPADIDFDPHTCSHQQFIALKHPLARAP